MRTRFPEICSNNQLYPGETWYPSVQLYWSLHKGTEVRNSWRRLHKSDKLECNLWYTFCNEIIKKQDHSGPQETEKENKRAGKRRNRGTSMLICMCQEVYKKAQVRILIPLMKSSTVCLQKVIKLKSRTQLTSRIIGSWSPPTLSTGASQSPFLSSFFNNIMCAWWQRTFHFLDKFQKIIHIV